MFIGFVFQTSAGAGYLLASGQRDAQQVLAFRTIVLFLLGLNKFINSSVTFSFLFRSKWCKQRKDCKVRSAKDMQEKMNKLVENLFDYGVTIEELPVVKAIFEDGLDYLEDLINEGMSSSNEMIWDNIK